MKKMERRKFLKLAGTAALAASLNSVLAGCGGGAGTPAPSDHQPTPSEPGSSSSASSNPASSSSEASSGNLSTKIIWKISDNRDGTAVLTGYDAAGSQPTGELTLPTEWSGRTIVGLNGGLGGKITKRIIPGTYKNVDYADGNYYGSNVLKELVLKNGVETVTGFKGSKKLSSIQFSSTLKEIGDVAFNGCESLSAVSLPAGLKKIGQYAFADTGLLSIVLPDAIEEYGQQAFAQCQNLTKAVLRSSSTGWRMFMGCVSLTDVELPQNLTKLADAMFLGCSALKKISLPQKLARIGADEFRGCKSLMEITILATVTEIGSYAFEKTAISKAAIPYGVKELEWGTFGNCVNLRAVYIPSTLRTIQTDCFSGCKNLTDVYYQASSQEWASISVDNNNTLLQAAQMHYYASLTSMS